MSDAVNDLVLQVINEASFDIPSVSALRWLTTRQRTMVDRSRCYRKTVGVSLAPASSSIFTLPGDALEVYDVFVQGLPVPKVQQRDAALVTQTSWADNNLQSIRIIPTPSAGDAATVRVQAAFAAPDLVAGDNTTLVVPDAYTDALVAGAIATGFARVEERPDLAAPHEQIFSAACEELRKDTARKMRGFGPSKIRVRG